jgi:hypothetical protein
MRDNARAGGGRGGAGSHAGRAGGRESAAHDARPAPSALTLGGRLSLHPDRATCCGAVWGLCFGCELVSRPNVLVVCDQWLEDSCTGSLP